MSLKNAIWGDAPHFSAISRPVVLPVVLSATFTTVIP